MAAAATTTPQKNRGLFISVSVSQTSVACNHPNVSVRPTQSFDTALLPKLVTQMRAPSKPTPFGGDAPYGLAGGKPGKHGRNFRAPQDWRH